jgi:hypothetical protein
MYLGHLIIFWSFYNTFRGLGILRLLLYYLNRFLSSLLSGVYLYFLVVVYSYYKELKTQADGGGAAADLVKQEEGGVSAFPRQVGGGGAPAYPRQEGGGGVGGGGGSGADFTKA